jgi:hypothetical protein
MNGIDEEVKKAYDIINLKQELRITLVHQGSPKSTIIST